ncbi:MAG: hypothetical protein ACD_77C00145G0004 [uncultured bacterium]|nr:MAG: hypothetical protein ACD_77C00145G0004 [uncultured bacterium]HBY02115.1 hypothetical protein [Rikenellaceae bacterium]
MSNYYPGILNTFSLEFSNFLNQLDIEFKLQGNLFFIDKFKLAIEIVELNTPESMAIPVENHDKTELSLIGYKHITLYEDEWRTKSEIITSRLLINLGKSRTVFARNCEVRLIDSNTAKKFLNWNHLLGHTAASYYYALFVVKGTESFPEISAEPIAVAVFSSPRPMNRDGEVISSYEWVRYASRRGVRVAGGMGKLMNCFIKEHSPQEIMSYADRDWSEGDVYKKLGFRFAGYTPPIDFVVNPVTFERVSIKKLRRKFGEDSPEMYEENALILRNRGNLKFLRRLSFS